MKKIQDRELMEYYINKHNINNIFDEELISFAEVHSYEKGEQILKADTELTYYYCFVEGKIKVFSMLENGKSLLLRFYTDFDTLGDVEVFRSGMIRSNVEAVEDTLLIAFPVKLLREKCSDNAKFLHHVIRSLSVKLESISYNSSYNLLYPLINRLSSYLAEHITDKDYILLTSSYEDISDFLGTTYRHLHRTLNELEAKGVIKCEGKKISILNRDELRELSRNLYR